MSKLKLSLLGALVVIAALLAYVFIPTHVRLGSKITNQEVGEKLSLSRLQGDLDQAARW
ncbi:hypothetical protein QW180_19690 [Vibrio sinaloensis]|nr:hypothetical protein [Vibrio sinaloensis]